MSGHGALRCPSRPTSVQARTRPSSVRHASASSGETLPYIDARDSVATSSTIDVPALPSPSIYSRASFRRSDSYDPPPSVSSDSSFAATLPPYVATERLAPRAERIRSILPEAYTRQQSVLAAASLIPSALTLDFTEHLFETKSDEGDALHAIDVSAACSGTAKRTPDPDCDVWPAHGLRITVNLICLALFCVSFLIGGLFVPIYLAFRDHHFGRTEMPTARPASITMRTLIDVDTPRAVYNRTGSDGSSYHLVFSDEFNQDGRTFWPGDDPYWEAVDLHYRMTGNWEWLDPGNARTRNGALEIVVEKVDPASNHNLSYRSAMVAGWNMICFTGGLIEVSVTLPGNGSVSLWPAAWTMGNLGRAGYPASTDGTWPYSYSTCDVGTLPNQTDTDGLRASPGFSYLPGQKLSACTCLDEDHPGPYQNSSYVGRAAPEIDIFESTGPAFSQSVQVAPFDADREWHRRPGAYHVYANNSFDSELNVWSGNQYQEAISTSSKTAGGAFSNGSASWATYTLEWEPSSRGNGHIAWSQEDELTFTVREAALGPDQTTMVGQRLISDEPHYIVSRSNLWTSRGALTTALIFNVAISESFSGPIDTDLLDALLPTVLRVDYVRVWAPDGADDMVTCDPATMPTQDYIQNHLVAYTDWNLTDWRDAGYTFPKNRLATSC